LPSSKATIEIFDHLLANGGQPTYNHDLPSKTYAGYRNELQGKILAPLSKVVLKRTGKSLEVDLTGELTDFDITVKTGNLKIGLLKKI